MSGKIVQTPGAAREAVFSNANVIRRIKSDFVPVALKAALVNMPGDDAEGRLYGEIGRSKPAPQGICVVNSAGKVLSWAMSFDNDASVLTFLDRTLQQFRAHPAAGHPVDAERYMRFPSQRLADVADDGEYLPTPDHHPEGVNCPAKPGYPRGTMVAHLVGRTLDAHGRPITDTSSQENYVEDLFTVPTTMQEALAKSVAGSGTDRVVLPRTFAQLCMTYAYLGQLDVRPCDNPVGGVSDVKQCEFYAQRIRAENGMVMLRLYGKSDVSSEANGLPGMAYQHRVTLTWDGFVEMKGPRMTRLVLSAHGSERLKAGEDSAFARHFAEPKNPVAFLPAGRPMDVTRQVSYGILGEPAVGGDIGPGDPKIQPPSSGSAGAQERDLGNMGPQFAIFRSAAQDDLKLTAEQKQAVRQSQSGMMQGMQQFQQQVGQLPPGDQERAFLQFHTETANAVVRFTAGILRPDQQKRLRQIVLQLQGLSFTLGDPAAVSELKLTDAQRSSVGAVMQETQNRYEALRQRAQPGRNPQQLQQEAATVQKEQEAKIEAILTATQMQSWKTIIGKPLRMTSQSGG